MGRFVEDRDTFFRAFHGACAVTSQVIRLAEAEQRVAFAEEVANLPTKRKLLAEVFDRARVVAQIDSH